MRACGVRGLRGVRSACERSARAVRAVCARCARSARAVCAVCARGTCGIHVREVRDMYTASVQPLLCVSAADAVAESAVSVCGVHTLGEHDDFV